MDRVHLAQPAPRGRRLLVRLGLLAFCGGLLLLLSSRPADAAERQEPGLLDPVGTTLKATAREVDSFAGRATGSGSSAVGQAADTVRRTVAPQSRPAAGAARSAAATVRRGAPAVPSPVRRAAPPSRPVTAAGRTATRSLGGTAKPVTGTSTGPLDRAGKLAAGRTARAAAPVVSTLPPVGAVLEPVGSALAPVAGAVGGLVLPVVPVGLVPVELPLLARPAGRPRSGAAGPAGPAARSPGFEGGAAGPVPPTASQTSPVRLAADGAGSPAARPVRSWPALAGAVSLPGVPASAELPAGGPDPLSTSSGVGFGLVALAAVLIVLGPLGRGRARPDRSGVLSRSYLPLVSPA